MHIFLSCSCLVMLCYYFIVVYHFFIFLFYFFIVILFFFFFFFFFQAEDGIRDVAVTGVQTCALPICRVRGSISVSGEPQTIDAWISTGKDSMSGMGWHPSNSFVGDIFTGVKS